MALTVYASFSHVDGQFHGVDGNELWAILRP